MESINQPTTAPPAHLVVVRPQPAGRFTAQVVGLPEVRGVADTEAEALEQVQAALTAWLDQARWVRVGTLQFPAEHTAVGYAGHARDEAEFNRYVEEIRRFRQEVDQRECPNSSSTPTT